MAVTTVGLYTIAGWLFSGIAQLGHALALVQISRASFKMPLRLGSATSVLPSVQSESCPQTEPLNPSKHRTLDQQLARLYAEPTYRQQAYKALGGAIQVP